MSAAKPSFVSYVDFGLNLKQDKETNGDQVEMPTIRGYVDPTPQLLPGEVVLAELKCAIKYSLFSEQKKGLNGSLFCTNFRVAYVSSIQDDEEPDWKRNRLLAENDIALGCIEALWGISKGKRKKLTPRSKVPKRPKSLEIHCKDFRVHFFSFAYVDKAKATAFVNEILQHAYPDTEKSLFGFSYKGTKTEAVDELTFQVATDWDTELRRLGASNWKTVQINHSHSVCLSLPEVLVVPGQMRVPKLKEAAPQFLDSRLPTWSYSTPNRASLVRMANLIPDTEQAHLEEEIIKSIRGTNPGNRLQIIDLAKVCPPLPELKLALDRLKDICLPLNTKDLRHTDDAWFSGLENSKWIQYVAQCLDLATNIAESMAEKGTSIIIREPNANDYCCVIGSLVQLILDKQYRTKAGFEALIRKEWIVMGHRFLTRLGLVTNQTENEEAPIFLLFLDCVWQMMNQFPGSFQISETYLTALADSTHLGIFSEFMFDNIYQAKKWARECGKYNKTKFLSIWDWSVQFSDKFQSLFLNPVFEAEVCVAEELRNGDATPTNDDEAKIENGNESETTTLRPSSTMPLLSFWSQCYLRWLSPVAIIGGGAPSQYMAQCRLTQEIQMLQDELDELKTPPELRKTPNRNELFLSLNSSISSRSGSSYSEILTSSFPFTPLSPKEEYMAITARTIDRLDDLSEQNLSCAYSESDCSILEG